MDLDDLDVYADGPEPQIPQPTEGVEGEQKKPKLLKARRAPGRKKPKLTIEHLQQPSGLQDVFLNFPKWFQEGYRGKGHEVRDLRRLLELYQRWHPRVFPHGTYNQFEQALEKMSGTHSLKAVLDKMRQDLTNIVDPPPAQQDEQQHQQDEQQQDQGVQQQQQQGAGQHQEGIDDFGIIDDDELLALQAEDAALEAAEAAVPELFDDGLDEQQPGAAAQQALNPAGANQQNTAKRTMRDWSDDDDDDEPQAHDKQQQQQQPVQTATTEPAAAAGAGDADADYLEDLLDDMLEDQELGMPKADEHGPLEEGGQKQAHDGADSDMQNTQQQRSRLQRKVALADSSEDEDMADLEVQEAGAPQGEGTAEALQQQQGQQKQQHEALQDVADDDADEEPEKVVTKDTQQQQPSRHLILADDDSDIEPEEDVVAAAAPAVPSQPNTTQATDQDAVGTQQHEEFAPLVFGAESIGFDSVDEMQLVMGTDLDGLQQ